MGEQNKKKKTEVSAEKREIVTKVLQYGMLLALLAIAFTLPAYGLRRHARESGEKNTGLQERAGQNQTTETQGAEKNLSTQNPQTSKGTIVIDAGHGGSQLRETTAGWWNV